MKPSTSISLSLRFGKSLIRKVKKCFTGCKQTDGGDGVKSLNYKPTDGNDVVKSLKNCMYYSDMSAEQRNEMITSAISYCKGIALSVGDWYFDRSSVKAIDCAYPCDKTCHNLIFK